MAIHPLAGQPAPANLLIDVTRLEREYYERQPDMDNPLERVRFGTSGHRGTPENGTFTEAHILAIAQAICDYRRFRGIDGPLFLGKDTHAVSGPAERTALEVLVANGVETFIQRDDGVTPTPVIPWAILNYNHSRREHRADGIVVTPSHNSPRDGGFKCNPPHGGPADTEVTAWIEDRANALLRSGNADVKRLPWTIARQAAITHEHDFVIPYVQDLGNIIDMDAIRSAGLKLGADPLGGASVHYWEPVQAVYHLDITLVNPVVDPRFAFMTVDHDGQRLVCGSAIRHREHLQDLRRELSGPGPFGGQCRRSPAYYKPDSSGGAEMRGFRQIALYRTRPGLESSGQSGACRATMENEASTQEKES